MDEKVPIQEASILRTYRPGRIHDPSEIIDVPAGGIDPAYTPSTQKPLNIILIWRAAMRIPAIIRCGIQYLFQVLRCVLIFVRQIDIHHLAIYQKIKHTNFIAHTIL